MEVHDAIAASPGIAIAPAFPMESEEFVVSVRPVEADAVEDEIQRFEEAVAAAVEELGELRRGTDLPTEIGQLFDAHIVLLQDKKIHEQVKGTIRDQRLPAEYCVRSVLAEHAERLAVLDDEYFAERARDIHHIEHRILRMLTGARQEEMASLSEPVIVVARDLTPSQTARLDKKHVKGMVVDLGGRTSHTAIVARSLGIPAVVGLGDLSSQVKEGTMVVVDGNRGRVIVGADPETVSAYRRLRGEYETYRRSLERSRHLPAETRDGHRIRLHGNIEAPRDASQLVAAGGEGVGLFRTEFLFTDPRNPPTEEQHYRAYIDTLERLEGRPLVIRTLDVGGDKILADRALELERNPFMGLRSIRYCLARPAIFRPQLRAILRASNHGDVRIMFPMVDTVEEVRQAKQHLADAMDRLRREKVSFNPDIRVGVMVETPAAALTTDLLAREVDFFSVGTNDLIQYTMAVDRGNERVAGLYQPAHPSILRTLARIIRAGVESDVEVAVCGEICSEPRYTLLLLGMGLRELSLVPSAIPEIKKVIRSVTMERAKEVATTAISMGDAQETERFLQASLRQVLPMIF